ncbi:hypothetical protein Cme02nite_65540 [Catellatospora methionotrophica]|uniref:Uncharacterized protein n=1 Tax=Catellatospora methionotrophica TaxID=121620 RepID=A0A8J3LC68_9ACTN|nr:hypothetical protein Cme02nite_65540 [Catellatospora methionotrophica]
MDLRPGDERRRGLVRAEVDHQEMLCHSEAPEFASKRPEVTPSSAALIVADANDRLLQAS